MTLAIVFVAILANNPTYAQTACVAQLSTPIASLLYNNSNIDVLIPVSASCSSANGQMYAIGDAYDTTMIVDLGSANTALAPFNGGSIFNGQLAFDLPLRTQGHTVQFSVSIYNGQQGYYSNGQYGTLVTTAVEVVQLNLNIYPNNYYQGESNLSPPYYNSHEPYEEDFITTVTETVPNAIQPVDTWLVASMIAGIVAITVVLAMVIAVFASRKQQPWQNPQHQR